MFLQSIFFGQKKIIPKTDFNTLFVCIDSISYHNLFQNKYLRDTLFFCREIQQETNTDSYTGKYLIGESSTIEFFQPKNTAQIGDHLGDLGIEFKTRKIKILDEIIEKSKVLKFSVDTSTTLTILDSLSIPWYKTLSLTNPKNELSILEYQADYLLYLGFTKKQISQSMTFKEYNSILSNGKKYPRQFNKIKSVTIQINKSQIEGLKYFCLLNEMKQKANTFYKDEFAINFEIIDQSTISKISKIEIELIDVQPQRTIEVSNNLMFKISNKTCEIIFKNNY